MASTLWSVNARAPWRRSLEEEHLAAIENKFVIRAFRNLALVLGSLLTATYIGSGFFLHFDPSLYGYAVATLVAAAGLTLRYTAWMMRPATRVLVLRYMEMLTRRVKGRPGREFVIRGAGRRMEGERPHPAGFIAAEMERVRRSATPGGSPGLKGDVSEGGRVTPIGLKVAFSAGLKNIILNSFIFKRGSWRGWQHFFLMWGVIGSFAITIPLVLGWLYFEAVAQDSYRVFFLGLPILEMPVRGVLSTFVFHALSIFSVFTLMGTLMAIYRRAWFRDAAVDQRVEYDLFPLYLLLGVTVTGLSMTVSHNWFDGVGYPFISATHQVSVVFLLLYLPFGKFFHIFLRPLAIAAEVYHEVGSRMGVQACARCGKGYASARQIQDVKAILAETGLEPVAPGGDTHTADYCPECRRVLRGLLYTRRLQAAALPSAVKPQNQRPNPPAPPKVIYPPGVHVETGQEGRGEGRV